MNHPEGFFFFNNDWLTVIPLITQVVTKETSHLTNYMVHSTSLLYIAVVCYLERRLWNAIQMSQVINFYNSSSQSTQ